MKTALAALLAGMLLAPASGRAEGVDNMADIQRIRDATPSCKAHPNARYIGRVSGNTQDAFDQNIPVSFVGCFDDLGTCELWKQRTSSIITGTIIQYSCRPR
jgi:hypothetical protein